MEKWKTILEEGKLHLKEDLYEKWRYTKEVYTELNIVRKYTHFVSISNFSNTFFISTEQKYE